MSRYSIDEGRLPAGAFGDDCASEVAAKVVDAATQSAKAMPGCSMSMPGIVSLRAMAESVAYTSDRSGAGLADVSFLTLCAAVVAAQQAGVSHDDFRDASVHLWRLTSPLARS